MHEFVTARRKDDVVIAISQDNNSKIIEIVGLNKATEDLLCYKENELLHKPLINILSSDSRNMIEDNLEDNDLSDVLSKINSLSLAKSNREEVKVKIKAFRTGNSTSGKINYELLIRDLSLSHKLHIFRNQYLNGRKYNIHPSLEIIDEPSTMLELEVILNFVREYKINAVAGLIGYHSDNKVSTQNTLKAIVDSLQRNYRGEDIIGYLGDDKIIFILMGCKPMHSNDVVLRLHSKISQSVKISIGYIDILDEKNNIELLAELKLALHAAQVDYGGQSCIRYTQAAMGINHLSED